MKKKELPYMNKAGFKVPEGYFQDFESRMMHMVSREHEGEITSEENPFKVPAGYFEQFEQKMLKQIEKEPKKVKVIPLFKKKTLSYVSAVAAVLVVLLTSTIFNSSQEISYEDLDMVAVENYLLETLNFDNPEVPQMMENRDYSFAADSNFDDEAIFEYLNENIEEPSVLFNEE